jgi:DNA gyrase/topoisomerase IV subunit A
VLEPKSAPSIPTILMESLYKLTELENRVPLNMNVLSGGIVPKVMNLREVLREWLEHRREVLLRRSRNRLGKIEKRLEVLDGFLIAYLNIDEVIRIVRFEDEPKAKLIERFELTDVQAEAILNLRLRALNKLEEIEIRKRARRTLRRKGRHREAARLRGTAVEDGLLGNRQREGRSSARTPSLAPAARPSARPARSISKPSPSR